VVKKCVTEGFIKDFETTYLGKEGKRVKLSISAAVRSTTNGVVIDSICRDITERVQAEEALRESEAYYRLLAENITDLIWMMDMSLRFTYMSPSVTRIGGYSVDEAMALSLAEILTPASFEIAVKVFEEELVAEQTRSREAFWSRVMELEQRHKDGHTIWTEVTTSFLRDPDGQPVGILGVTRDITERVQAQEEIRVRLEEFSMLNRFSQSVARTLLKTDEIAMLVAQQFVDVMGLPECSVSLYDPGKGTLKTQWCKSHPVR